MTSKYSVRIFNADSKIIKTEMNYHSKEAAERAANNRREEIERRGWNMKVDIISYS